MKLLIMHLLQFAQSYIGGFPRIPCIAQLGIMLMLSYFFPFLFLTFPQCRLGQKKCRKINLHQITADVVRIRYRTVLYIYIQCAFEFQRLQQPTILNTITHKIVCLPFCRLSLVTFSQLRQIFMNLLCSVHAFAILL